MSDREQFEAWARSIGYKDEFYFFTNAHPNHYDDDRTEDMWAAWQASREALKAEQGGDGWISCADRMPERGGQYCVWNGAHVGLVTYLFGSFQCLYPEQITHWQQHPSPPSHHPIDTTPNQYDALGKGGEQ